MSTNVHEQNRIDEGKKRARLCRNKRDVIHSLHKTSERGGGEHDGDRVANTAREKHQVQGKCTEIVIQLVFKKNMHVVTWHVQEQLFRSSNRS